MIIKYFKKVVFRWWILLGLMPEALERIALYFNMEIKVPEEYTIYLCFAFLFVSTYLVWKEEKEKVEALEEKSKNPVDYEITAEIYPLDDDIENSIQSLENIIDNTQKELYDINIQLHKETIIKLNKDNIPDLENGTIASLCYDMQSIQQNSFPNINNTMQNQREISYKNSLETYIADMKKYIDDMKDYYETRKGKIFYVIFVIHNTGSIFDEHIGINISSNNSIFSKTYNFDNTPVKPTKPEKPKNSLYEDPLNFNLNHIERPYLNNSDIYPHRLRRNVEIKKTNINLVFRDLKVDVEENVLENILFVKSDDLNDLKFEISSKNSNKKIQKKVTLEMKDKLTLHDIYNMLYVKDND